MMKKIILTKKQKKIGICLFSIALVASLLFIFTTITATENKTTTRELYSYEYQPSVSYSVFIKDNPIYSENKQEEGNAYIKNLLDHIELKVGGNFSSSESSNIDITYSLKAVVSATSTSSSTENEGEEKKDLTIGYSKDFNIIPSVKKRISNSNFNLDETVNIELDNYINFANEAKVVTGLTLTPYLYVLLEGEIVVNTPYSPITIPIKSGISLPLNSDVFTITKTGNSSIVDNLSTSSEIVVKKPFNTGLVFAAIFISLILILAIIYFAIFSMAPSHQYLINKKTKKLIKDYNSRIVVLNNFDKDSFNKYYTVKSFNDLIKLADEIEKPIYTVFSTNDNEPSNVFFTFDENSLYSFIVDFPNTSNNITNKLQSNENAMGSNSNNKDININSEKGADKNDTQKC